MKVGIIGNGIHSKRIQVLLNKQQIKFYVYKPNKPKYFNSYKLEKLKENNIIFILSPNHTHFNYIKKLYKNRFIFCEKPSVINQYQLQKIKNLKSNRLYVNFNKRFSFLSNVINKYKKKLGDITYFNIVNTHGLAQTKKFKNSWRANSKLSRTGTLENVSIHDIDLINFHFGIKSIKNISSNFSLKNFNSFSEVTLKNRTKGSIFSSYDTSLNNESIFMFKNGYIKQDTQTIKVFYPTKTFDKMGYFKIPPIIFSKKIDFKKDFIFSLEKSLNYFLKYAKNSKKFDRNLINQSLETAKYTLL